MAEGVSPVYVQQQAGHASVNMTVGVYESWFPVQAPGAMDRLGARLRRADRYPSFSCVLRRTLRQRRPIRSQPRKYGLFREALMRLVRARADGTVTPVVTRQSAPTVRQGLARPLAWRE